MANQIQATVYQIDGSPLSNPIQIAFLTSNVYMREYQTDLIPDVNSAIIYYPNTNNQLQEQTFLASETIGQLVSASNSGGRTQISTTVLEINQEPQIPSGLTFSFPVQGISIWPATNPIVGGVNSFIEFKNKKYYLLEDEDALVTDANSGGSGTSTGINGLTGTTNIGLGGTLANDTTIDQNDFNITFDKNGIESFNVFSKYYLSYTDSDINYLITPNGNDLLLQYDNGNTSNQSILRIGEDGIFTDFNGTTTGLKLNNNIASLGDYDGVIHNTALIIDDENYALYTNGSNGSKIGLDFDFLDSVYRFGIQEAQMSCSQNDETIEFTAINIKFTNVATSSTGSVVIPQEFLNIVVNGQNRKLQLFA